MSVDRRVARLLVGVVLASTAAATAATSAAGDGLPVPGGLDTTHQGVLGADGRARYLAIPHDGTTVVERIDAANGVLQAERPLQGEYVVPGVTIGGDTSGLAHDESALVLIRPRTSFPQTRTSMILLEPRTLRARRRIVLDGDFSFDAISPDGATAYLIQYPDPRDPTAYRLRRLDLATGRLVPGAIRAQNDPAEEMRGFPLARATGADGRWEYTLYDGGTIYRYGPGKAGEPFVHAIDTVAGRTLCIDLGWITPRQVPRVHLLLAAGGSEVDVVDPGVGVIGAIDTATGEAREVSEPVPASASGGEDESGGGLLALAIAAVAVGLALLVAAGFALRARRHRRRDGPEVAPSGPAAA